jgi:hypothetical protein
VWPCRPGRSIRPKNDLIEVDVNIELLAKSLGVMQPWERQPHRHQDGVRCSMGQLLRTKRHTATGKHSQVLIAAVNRHMPATPDRGNQPRIKDANEVTILMRQLTRSTKNMAKTTCSGPRSRLHALHVGQSPVRNYPG